MQRYIVFVSMLLISIASLVQDSGDIIKPEIMEDLCQLLFVTVVNMSNSPEPLR